MKRDNKVKLKYEKEAEYLIKLLEDETGTQYVQSYDGKDKTYNIVPIKIINNKISFEKPLTEEELKELSERGWIFYRTAKRVIYLPIESNYYEIWIGNVLFGGATEEKGRYSSLTRALEDFKACTISELMSHFYSKYSKFNPVKLLYYKHERAKPIVIKEYKTVEDALKELEDELEKHVREFEREEHTRLPRPWRKKQL